MANIIHVAPEKLSGTARVFEQTARDIKTICQGMTGTVQTLTGRVWSGGAATAYKTRFNMLQGDINRLHGMVAAHASHLEQIAREYKTGDEQNALEAGRLSGGVVS